MCLRRHTLLPLVLLGIFLVPVMSVFAQQAPPATGDEAALIAVLQSSAPLFDKAKACQQLAVIGTKNSVPALAKLLADDELSHYARFALEPLPDPSVDEALRASLNQLQGGLLVGVINSIGMRRDVQAVDALKTLLANTDPSVAAAAAAALGRIASAPAVDALKASLGLAEPVKLAVAEGCLTAADTLEKQGQMELAASLYDAMRAAQLPKYQQIAALAGAIRSRGPQGVELLVEQLKSEDRNFFGVGLSMANLIPDARVTETLVAEISKPLPGPEAEAPALIITKAQYGAKDTWVDVTQTLQDAVQGNGISIVAGNQLAGDPVPSTPKSLKVSYTVGGDAKNIEVGEGKTFEIAGAPVVSHPRETSVVDVLGKRGDRAALPVILKLAQQSPSDVRLAAIRALAKLGDASAVPLLLEVAAASSSASAAALDSLATLPDKGADAKIQALLDSSSGPQRLVVIEVLGRRGVASATPALLKLASNDEKATRAAAFAALGLTVGQDDLAALAQHLVKPAAEDEAAAAKTALEKACQRMPDRDAAARVLIAQLRGDAPKVRAGLLDLLRVLGGAQALAHVVSAAKASDPQLQDAATQVLGQWTSPDAAPALLELTKAAGNKYKVRTLRGYIRIARQLNVPTEQRIAMCRQALELADRDEDRILVLDTLGRYPSAESLAIVTANLDKSGLAATAAKSAVAIGDKLVAQQPAEVAKVMKQVLATSSDNDLKQKATRVLSRAEGK